MATDLTKIPLPSAQLTDPDSGICDQYWYDYFQALGDDVKNVADTTSKSQSRIVSFLDFVPDNLIESVIDGTNTTDLGQYWQAFRDALADMETPGGFIPACTILTSASPNFAITNLQLVTGGDVLIKSTVSGPGSYGFYIDGTTGVGQYISGFVTGIKVQRLRVSAPSAEAAFYTTNCVSCEFEFTCSGAVTYGILIGNTVSNIYRRPLVKFPMDPAPYYGIYLADLASNNTFDTMNVDICQYGVWLGFTFLNNFYGGTSESNAKANLWADIKTRFAHFYGVDFEGSPSEHGVYVLANGVEFFGCNCSTDFHFGPGGSSNNVFGGVITSLEFEPGANSNYVSGLILGDTSPAGLIDNGDFNQIVGVAHGINRVAGTRTQQTIVVGASPFSYFNNTGNNQIVNIEGTGVSNVNMLRDAGPGLQMPVVASGHNTYLIGPSDFLTIFYSTAPVITVLPI